MVVLLAMSKWKKGQSGNPKGRPRSPYALANKIRDQVDPDELIALALSIARGEPQSIEVGEGQPIPCEVPTTKDRLAAMKFLADRGYVAPPKETIAHNTQDKRVTFDFSRLSDSELDDYYRLLKQAQSDGDK